MLGNFELASLLPLVTLVSVILTIVVGVLGLRQGFFSKGKYTRRGRRMIAVLVALGATTMLSSIVDQQLSDAKEERDAEVRLRQFDRQMASVRSVQLSISQAQNALQSTLIQQGRLLDVANQNVRRTIQLQAQAEANAANILGRVTDEGNRFTVKDIIATLAARECRTPDGPIEFGHPIVSTVHVEVAGPSGLISIASHEATPNYSMIWDQFQGFEGSLVGYETPSAWRNANIRITVYGDGRSSPQPRSLLDPPENRALGRPPTTCRMDVSLSANGRSLWSAAGTYTEIYEQQFMMEVSIVRDRRRKFFSDILLRR